MITLVIVNQSVKKTQANRSLDNGKSWIRKSWPLLPSCLISYFCPWDVCIPDMAEWVQSSKKNLVLWVSWGLSISWNQETDSMQLGHDLATSCVAYVALSLKVQQTDYSVKVHHCNVVAQRVLIRTVPPPSHRQFVVWVIIRTSLLNILQTLLLYSFHLATWLDLSICCHQSQFL